MKSFEHPFDRMEDRCTDVLNLVSEFDDRAIRDRATWRKTLQPRLRKFLSAIPAPGGRLRIAIDTHATLAFAAGAVLDTKSGRVVEIEQRSPMLKVWAPDDQAATPDWTKWEFVDSELKPDGHGTACAVSVTRDAESAVRHYIQRNLPNLRRLLVAKPQGGASQASVTSGAHANTLAETLAAKIKFDRESNRELQSERFHLFISAPNAFTFYLGRHAQVIKPLTLYEFDFERQVDGSYRPSLSYPEIGLSGLEES